MLSSERRSSDSVQRMRFGQRQRAGVPQRGRYSRGCSHGPRGRSRRPQSASGRSVGTSPESSRQARLPPRPRSKSRHPADDRRAGEEDPLWDRIPTQRSDMTRSKPITFLATAAVIPLAALAFASCGGGDSNASGSSASPKASPPPAARHAQKPSPAPARRLRSRRRSRQLRLPQSRPRSRAPQVQRHSTKQRR